MERQESQQNVLKDIPASAWDKLAKKKIYFGHQSVGYNIIDGMKDIMKENPQIKLNIVETSDAGALSQGMFAHSRVGQNTDPKSKIDGFTEFLQKGIGEKADAVALKFCYVDVMGVTDVVSVFSEYEKQIEKIRQDYPELTIIHCTVPLTDLQAGPKAWVKKIIGRPLSGTTENIKRHEYNELLRNRFRGKEPILDIAQIESTYPDGSRRTFEMDGKTYYSIVPEYTNDGGHLNETGRKKVAEQLLLLLQNS